MKENTGYNIKWFRHIQRSVLWYFHVSHQSKDLIFEWSSDSPTRSEQFGGRVKDCWASISAVFPLEATRGWWQCSQNVSQALGAALPCSRVRFTRRRSRQSGGRVVHWSAFSHAELWVLDTDRQRLVSWTIMKGWSFWLPRFAPAHLHSKRLLWWKYNVFWIKVANPEPKA